MAEDMFRAPIHRSLRRLDRSLFRKNVQLEAAQVFDDKQIAHIKSSLQRSKDILVEDRIPNVRTTPDSSASRSGQKCILLRPTRVASQSVTRSSVLQELIEQKVVEIIPYSLTLDYDHWSYYDIISAILPEDEQSETPSGFTQTGHIAHLNIRDQYLQYRYLIGEILLDKTPSVRTVINKIADVGEENEYRTFKYEVLAGEDDMDVSVSEGDCTYEFDFSKVYWNSRLHNEHRRMVELFKKGEAVCDVMAGVGPFAIPAGKKKVFVWANDLNPDSYDCLQKAIKRNKVQDFVKPSCADGRHFIRNAVLSLWQGAHKVDIKTRASRNTPGAKPVITKTLKQPRTFQHFVMNLPASALSFLPSFIGLYPAEIKDQLPAEHSMPLIHVYCFNTKSDDNTEEASNICKEISELLQYELKPGKIEDGDVEIHDVRDVAPKKRMFCASFRLPREVAFREI